MYPNVGMRIDTARYVGIQTIHVGHTFWPDLLEWPVSKDTQVHTNASRPAATPRMMDKSPAVAISEPEWRYATKNAPELVGGWTNPSEKYARQIGSFPQGENKQWVATA